MATFAYVARDPSGQRVEGKLAGASSNAVLAELTARELAPVRIELVPDRAGRDRRIRIRHLSTAYRQLSDLLRAGVPLLRALRLLSRGKSSPRLAAVMGDVADAVADGSRMADSMEARGEVFPVIQVAMVRAGERGGFLEPVLRRLATFLEHQADLRARVIGSLIYPAVLFVVMVAIVIIALVALVPKFRDFYSRIELPLPTKILLGASDLMTMYGIFVAAGFAFLLWGGWRITKHEAVARRWRVWILKAPLIGELVRSLAIGRFARLLGTLLENGIPVLSAMRISRDAVGHRLLADAIDDATESVQHGETLAGPLGRCELFQDDIVEMISVGESANNLPEVLITIADTIEARVDRMLTVAVRLIEPLLLLTLGGAVLFIFIALIVPMMRMSSSLGTG